MEHLESLSSSLSSSILGQSLPGRSLQSSAAHSVFDRAASPVIVEEEDVENLVPKLVVKRMSMTDALEELKRIQKLDEAHNNEPPTTEFQYSKRSSRSILVKAKLSGKTRKYSYPPLTMNSTVQEIQDFLKTIHTPESVLGLHQEENSIFVDTSPSEPPLTFNSMLQTLPMSQEKTISNPFFILCEDVLNALAEFETYMQTFSSWKDDFFKQNVTSGMKLNLALLVAKLIRAQSDLTQMVLEIVRCVRIYSMPWTDKLSAILTLEEQHIRQEKAFDIALGKIEALHAQLHRLRASKQIFLWEYITKKLVRTCEKREKLKERGKVVDLGSNLLVPSDDEDDDDDDDDDHEEDDETENGQEQNVLQAETEDQTSGKQQTLAKCLNENENTGTLCSVQTQTDITFESELFSIQSVNQPGHPVKGSKKQRLHEVKELLASKKQARLNPVANPNPEVDLFSQNELSQQKFNALLNQRFPHLPKTIYQYRVLGGRHHPLLYPSEIVYLQSTTTSSSEKPVPGNKVPWTTDDISHLVAPVAYKSLVRCNSTNALNQLAETMSPTLNFVAEAEKTRNALENFSKSIFEKRPGRELHFDEYLTNISSSRQSSDAFSKVDIAKTWFSLQDVLELSMLHMQQINQLRVEYENKLLQLRNLQVNCQIKKSLPEIRRALSPAYRKASTPSQKIRVDMSPKMESRKVETVERSSPPVHYRTSLSVNYRTSPPVAPVPRNFKRSMHLPPVPRYIPKQPSFLNLSFLERMALMSMKSRSKKNSFSEKLLREQFEENLTKMIVDKNQLFTRDQVAELMETILPAIFMPTRTKRSEPTGFPLRSLVRVRDRGSGRSTPRISNYNDNFLALYPETHSK